MQNIKSNTNRSLSMIISKHECIFSALRKSWYHIILLNEMIILMMDKFIKNVKSIFEYFICSLLFISDIENEYSFCLWNINMKVQFLHIVFNDLSHLK
jgi:hypothetical protein